MDNAFLLAFVRQLIGAVGLTLATVVLTAFISCRSSSAATPASRAWP
jgi:hypothetical protein